MPKWEEWCYDATYLLDVAQLHHQLLYWLRLSVVIQKALRVDSCLINENIRISRQARHCAHHVVVHLKRPKGSSDVCCLQKPLQRLQQSPRNQSCSSFLVVQLLRKYINAILN